MLKNFFEGQDYFGYHFKMLFNGKPEHTTVFGGIVSVVIKVILLLYTYVNFKKLVLHEDDKNLSVTMN